MQLNSLYFAQYAIDLRGRERRPGAPVLADPANLCRDPFEVCVDVAPIFRREQPR